MTAIHTRCRYSECRKAFTANRIDKIYCSRSCRTKQHLKAQRRGAVAYNLLIAWRKTKNKNGELTALSRLVDTWIKIDA